MNLINSGTEPEDVSRLGKKVRKIDIVDVDQFYRNKKPEDDIVDRRIILNTNLSSTANPMSGRNLDPALGPGVSFPRGPFSGQMRR